MKRSARTSPDTRMTYLGARGDRFPVIVCTVRNLIVVAVAVGGFLFFTKIVFDWLERRRDKR